MKSKFIGIISALTMGAMMFTSNIANAALIYGDVSGDGIVDSADYTLVRRYLIGTQKTLPAQNWQQAGDVNLDGVIDSADFTHIRRYLLGIISSLPIGGPTTTLTPTPKPTNTPTPTPKPSTQLSYKFDFGGGGVQSGYTGVSASLAYSKTTGYGFNTPSNMKNVTASGSGASSDAVQFVTFGTKSTNTFNVDLPNGLYEIKVTLGNTSRASVAAEGVFQIINMTGNNATDKFQIPITDGQLNILVTEGKAGTAFTLSALEINKLSDNPVTNKTVYVGGDSTVCNYYPLDTSVQAGTGQMLPKYISTSTYQIRNMAASGQCARGFRDDGQFEAIMKYIKSGDIFILQFGINDTAEKNATTETQFKEIMTDMVKKVKAKGATMVLSTPQGRATDFNSSNAHTAVNRWYRQATLAVAKEQSVPLVDLNVLSSSYFTSIGPAKTLTLFMSGDTLHPNRAGATELARIMTADLKKQGIAN